MRLTRTAFVKWLRDQRPGRRFKLGTGNEPLLQWATETSKIYPRMGWNWPPWTTGFIAAQFCWIYEHQGRKILTARECLALLGEKP